MAGAVFSKGGFSPSLVASFWFAADDVSTTTPASLTDRITGAVATPIGATGGTLETTGWAGQQKSIIANGQGWQSSAAAVVNTFNASGGVNWWLCLVGMMLPDAASNLMPDQTLFSAGLSSDAQKYMALQERQALGTQRWIQRFGAGAETQDNSTTTLQSPEPYIWLLQCDGAGVRSYLLNGYTEQAFTRVTGGALSVDRVLFGGLIQGGTQTADGRERWRHKMGGLGTLSAGNVTELLNWINNDSRGFNKYKGVVGNWCTKTNLLVGGPAQSNHQGQGSPATAVTTTNVFNFGFDSFVVPLADPWCNSTNTPWSSIWGGTNGNGIGSAMPAFVNQMAALGKFNPATESIVTIPSGRGGSSMAAFWVQGASTSWDIGNPPPWNSPLGAVCLRLEHANKNFPNPFVGLVYWYQGESDALAAGTASTWGASNRAQLCRLVINNFITVRSIPKTAGFRHAVCILPVTNYSGATPANWGTERTSQQTFAASFADCTSIQVDNGPFTDGTDLHVEVDPPQNDIGTALAGLWS